MPTVADFRAVHDTVHHLSLERPLVCRFEMPPHLARTAGEPQCVLLVKYFLEGASALTWELLLNGTRLFESSGSGSHLLMNMEAFDANVLLPGENVIECRFIRGLGTIRIADMVVHFRVAL